MEKIVMKVDGMSCGHCKAAVEKALLLIDGVQGADADIGAKTVAVTYDDGKVSRDVLAEAITEAGYEVKD